jgi:hypothetical protein
MEEDNIVISTSKSRVPRNFSMSAETNERFEKYLKDEFGRSYMVSAIIEKAIREFLDKEEKDKQKLAKKDGD